MIKIIEDPSNLIKDANYIYLYNYNKYVSTYQLIQNSIIDNKNLTIVIKKSVFKIWFEKLATRYEDHIFEFDKITYRTRLEELWGIKIPEEFDGNDLEKLDLFNLEVYPKPNDNFRDFILTYFFDPIFSNSSFTTGLIVQLIKSYDKQKWDKNFESNLLRIIYHERINEWKNKIKDENLLLILDDILKDPDKMTIELMIFKILRTKLYNEIGKINFKDKFEKLQKLKLNLKDIDIDYNEIEQIIKQIEIHLNTQEQPKKHEEIEVLLTSLSGLVPVEYYYIENILLVNQQFITSTIISQIKAIFAPIYSKVGKRIQKLNDLIPPPRPDILEVDSEIEDVKKWLVKKYLPYQNWLLKNNLFENDFIEIGDSFSNWFFTNWEDFKGNSNSLVSNWLYNNSFYFENHEKINVVLIVDNLFYSNAKLIQELFTANDINLIASEPYFSMIPSETETSKKCLLSGKTSYTEIDQNSYTDILDKGWIPYFNSSNFIYISDLDKFENISIEKSKTYFVNYHSIDIILHQEQAKLGISHEKQISNLLKELVDRVTDLLENKNILNQTLIHIISDHGSTKFHSNTKNDLDPKEFKKKSIIKISERYAFINDEDFSNLPDNLKQDCFFLDKNRFGLRNHCLCARRGNTFKEYTFNSYLHGGLLPEEVVVPHLIFERAELKIQQPLVQLIRDKFRYKIEDIEFEISNPNVFAIEGIQLKITNSNLEALPFIIEFIDAKSKQILRIKGRFNKTNNKIEKENILLNLSFSVSNKIFEYEYKLKINMVSMVELKDTSMFNI